MKRTPLLAALLLVTTALGEFMNIPTVTVIVMAAVIQMR
jgi:hypothetical protein